MGRSVERLSDIGKTRYLTKENIIRDRAGTFQGETSRLSIEYSFKNRGRLSINTADPTIVIVGKDVCKTCLTDNNRGMC